MECAKVFARRQAVIEVALHLPVLQIELPVRATTQANPVSLSLARKRPAHFHMPAANQPVQPAFDRS